MVSDAEEKETEVVKLPAGVNFGLVMKDNNGKPFKELYFDDDDQKEGERLQTKLQLVKVLSEEDAERLMDLQRERERTIGQFCVNALYRPDEKADGNQMRVRGNLAIKIQGAAEPDAPWPTLRMSKKQKKLILKLGEDSGWGTMVYTFIATAFGMNDVEDDEIDEDDN